MTRRVLVTGGAGFIGGHVAEALLARGDEVVVVDDFSSGHHSNIPAGASLVEGDLSVPGVAAAAVAGCDGVIHCAAMPSVVDSVNDPVASSAANLMATAQLLMAARDAGVRRIVYSSTAAVYGDKVQGPAHEGLREDPLSPYGMNKLAAEQLLRMAPDLYGVDTLCLRYFNVFGPRQDPGSPYSGVISILVTKALAGEAPTLNGDGLQTRDFTYVGDVVSANLLALDAERGGGAVVNVGGGQGISLLEVWQAIRTAAGRPELEPLHGPPRAGDIRHSRAAVQAARDLLGFQAGVSLQSGLDLTVAWYRSRPSVRA